MGWGPWHNHEDKDTEMTLYKAARPEKTQLKILAWSPGPTETCFTLAQIFTHPVPSKHFALIPSRFHSTSAIRTRQQAVRILATANVEKTLEGRKARLYDCSCVLHHWNPNIAVMFDRKQQQLGSSRTGCVSFHQRSYLRFDTGLCLHQNFPDASGVNKHLDFIRGLWQDFSPKACCAALCLLRCSRLIHLK